MNNEIFQQNLEVLLKETGFEHFGWTRLETPMSMSYYKSWLNNNYHADMAYLARHVPQKEEPTKMLAKAKSAIVIGQKYFPLNKELSKDFPLKKLRVALYARQKDYHDWFQNKLNDLALKLKAKYPEHEFAAFTDSKPVLERDLAYRAGLGWVGKNTCLIHEKRGSLFFIGEIYSTLEINTQVDLHPDRCGTCTKCIDICPTGALVEPRILDANKCISYWTIEAKKNPPVNLRSHFQAWYFGCDLCQTVCPWNQKMFKQELKVELEVPAPTQELQKELLLILKSTPEELKKIFYGTALLRAKPWVHKRNAIMVAVHYGFTNLREEIQKLNSDPNLSEICTWALAHLP